MFPGVPGSNVTVAPSNLGSPTSKIPSPSVSYQTVSPILPRVDVTGIITFTVAVSQLAINYMNNHINVPFKS